MLQHEAEATNHGSLRSVCDSSSGCQRHKSDVRSTMQLFSEKPKQQNINHSEMINDIRFRITGKS